MIQYKTLIAQKASDLLYRRGISDVSVGDILKCSGASRGTFYKYFSDKEDVVCAALEYRDQEFRDFIARVTAGQNSVEGYIHALFRALLSWQHTNGFHGCLFQSALTEYQHLSERITAIARAHKQAFIQQLTDTLTVFGVHRPDHAALTATLLIEGAVALGNFFDPEANIQHARDAAIELLVNNKAER
ncbi:TetR/AcrR family transcriptional regulator [Brenneria goodwinii]|uniref:TetR/AcrR family transcriptional regulator n=1 Tax=Brenneria goodwinii TaxID=1109412 RepID=UPI0036E29540